MSALTNNKGFREYPILSAQWNEPPYLKGWRLDFSLVYSNNIFEIDANITHLNKALGELMGICKSVSVLAQSVLDKFPEIEPRQQFTASIIEAWPAIPGN